MKIRQKINEIRIWAFREENTWVWSLVAIFALLFTAVIILYYIYFSIDQ